LVSYNILDGGEGRADPLAEVIEAAKPDVVALVEADNLSVVERIAARLRMDYVIAQGREHAVALLSRWTIDETINHAALNPTGARCLLEARLTDPVGKGWVIGVVHLHARATEADETQREQELATVLDAFAGHRAENRPHLICGDFNANSPTQQIDIAKAHLSTRDAYAANGGAIPRRVVGQMLDAGYVDTFQAVAGDRADAVATFTTLHPQQRLDYVFAWGVEPSRVKDAWVEQDRLATYASDHYPIGVELD
jgi:endonuclease/exonuclease/phosphatase family metal-dependent hydrolase